MEILCQLKNKNRNKPLVLDAKGLFEPMMM